MKTDKVFGSLGLAMRAGKISSGEFMTEGAVKSGKAFLVIIAEDVSENTRKKFKNMCEFYEVPIREYGDKNTLGHCLGKEFRASLAVTDEGFAKAIMKKMD